MYRQCCGIILGGWAALVCAGLATGEPPAATRPGSGVAGTQPAGGHPATRAGLGEENEAWRRVQAYFSPIPEDIRFDGDVAYREVGRTKLRLDVYRLRQSARQSRDREGAGANNAPRDHQNSDREGAVGNGVPRDLQSRDREGAAGEHSATTTIEQRDSRARTPMPPGRPAVIYVHGGAWRLGSKAMGRALLIDLARRGYVAFSIDYRLLPEGRFPRCIEDCKAAVRWIQAHAGEYGVDPERIGLIGASAGAHLAALMAVSGKDDFRTADNAEQSGRVAAAVAFFGPFELRGYGEYAGGLVRQLIGGPETERAEAYRQASPIAYVEAAARKGSKTNPQMSHMNTDREHADKGKVASEEEIRARRAREGRGRGEFPPFLLIHGDADELVGIEQSRHMCRALCETGCEAVLIEVHGGTHGLMVGRMEPGPAEFRLRMFDFLDRHLGKRSGSRELDARTRR